MGANHILAFAGLAGSGKSTAAEIVTEYLNGLDEDATSTEVSDFVRTKYEAEHDDTVNDNDLGAWAAEQKDAYGDGYFVREMAEAWDEPDRPHVVISGLRSPEEAAALRDVFGDEHVTVVAVWTLPDVRFERKYGDVPHEEHDEYDTFVERNERETYDWDCVEYFLEDGPADYIVPNNASEQLLAGRVKHIASYEVLTSDIEPQLAYPFPESERAMVGQYL
jgi:hypothetical protein